MLDMINLYDEYKKFNTFESNENIDKIINLMFIKIGLLYINDNLKCISFCNYLIDEYNKTKNITVNDIRVKNYIEEIFTLSKVFIIVDSSLYLTFINVTTYYDYIIHKTFDYYCISNLYSDYTKIYVVSDLLFNKFLSLLDINDILNFITYIEDLTIGSSLCYEYVYYNIILKIIRSNNMDIYLSDTRFNNFNKLWYNQIIICLDVIRLIESNNIYNYRNKMEQIFCTYIEVVNIYNLKFKEKICSDNKYFELNKISFTLVKYILYNTMLNILINIVKEKSKIIINKVDYVKINYDDFFYNNNIIDFIQYNLIKNKDIINKKTFLRLYNFSSVVKKLYNNNNNICIDYLYLPLCDKSLLTNLIKKI